MNEQDKRSDRHSPDLIESMTGRIRRLWQPQSTEGLVEIPQWTQHRMEQSAHVDRWGNDWGD